MPRSREVDREYQRARRARLKAERDAPRVELRPAVDAPDSPPAVSKVHRAAVTRMLRATGLKHVPEEAPLIELVKTLAREVDEGGGPAVYSKYRAALADVRRVLAYNGRPQTSSDRVEAAPDESPAREAGEAPVNSLAAFRAKRGIG